MFLCFQELEFKGQIRYPARDHDIRDFIVEHLAEEIEEPGEDTQFSAALEESLEEFASFRRDIVFATKARHARQVEDLRGISSTYVLCCGNYYREVFVWAWTMIDDVEIECPECGERETAMRWSYQAC